MCHRCAYHFLHLDLDNGFRSRAKSGTIRRYLTADTAAQIIHAFVTSKLDYCNSLLYGLTDKSLFRLKKVQNTAVRIITYCHSWDDITPRLKELHWLPIHLRIRYKVILLTFKALNGLAPAYLRILLNFRVTPYSLRNETKKDLDTATTRTTSYGDRAFSAAAPVLWNVLPEEIRSETKLAIFKSKLKTHLFGQF